MNFVRGGYMQLSLLNFHDLNAMVFGKLEASQNLRCLSQLSLQGW